MNSIIKFTIAIVMFFIAFILLNNLRVFSIPIFTALVFFIIYYFIPDMGSSSNIVNENKMIFGFLVIVLAIVFLFTTKLILTSLLLILGLIILWVLMNNQKVISSLSTGFLLSFPLILLNPVYFIFAFLGFFTSWLTNR